MQDLHHALVRFRPAYHPISSDAQRDKLERDLVESSRLGGGGTGVSATEPPLYYALETIPYGLGSKGTILERLELMRLVSAFMGGLTALFAYLFLREALPRAPWAWVVGGLGVALAPLLGFISGVVNPDTLLSAVAAALFYCFARAFRRGLARPLALAIGALIAVGFLTKLNFVGMAPGAILGLILLARRERNLSGRRVYLRSLAPALLIAFSPLLLYALINLFSSHPTLGIVSQVDGGLPRAPHSISGELSYIWQFYFPRLPGMHNDFGELFTTRQVWFRGMVGEYGWLDTFFPSWVYDVALLPVAIIVALCVRELAVTHRVLRRRAAELVSYTAMGVGVLALVGAAGYREFPVIVLNYSEPRYLLPMIVLWGAVLTLAARGAGRRWGPAVGMLIVVLLISHDLFSQLQVIARYYG